MGTTSREVTARPGATGPDLDRIKSSDDAHAPDLDSRAVGLLGRAGLSHRAALRRPDGRRHDASGDLLEGPRPRPLEMRLRPALAPSGRWALWREPVPPRQAPPAPGHPEAL